MVLVSLQKGALQRLLFMHLAGCLEQHGFLALIFLLAHLPVLGRRPLPFPAGTHNVSKAEQRDEDGLVFFSSCV